MPAFITHDCFAHDVMSAHPAVCGDTRDEVQAFLLGSQGPDPLFFLPAPPPVGTTQLARTMHAQQPTRLLLMLRQALDSLEGGLQDVARSYAHGFLMHYLLDSTVHPLVYAQVDALCNAGVEGLEPQDAGVVHDFIERDLDEMVLYAKRNMTVRDFNPTSSILVAGPAVATAAQQLYAYLALTVYGQQLPANAFVSALLAYRAAKRLMWSRTGVKTAVAGGIESLFRRHSRVRSYSLRPVQVQTTWLANPDHDEWTHPFTGQVRTESFWDLYQAAQMRARAAVELFESPRFDEEAARSITADVNFRGEPTVATLTVVGEA